MSSFVGLVNQATSAVASLTGGRPNEMARQALADDALYWRDDVVCFFELRDGRSSYLFPLVNGVISHALVEPFANQVVNTLRSGLGVDEQGTLQRRLSISGHTGCAPHPLPIGQVPPRRSLLPKDFVDRQLPAQVLAALSGQKHFQYLQDTVFRAYSLLKRDIKTAEQARLLFHNPREREHWRVIPNSFSSTRGPGANTIYPFSIDLTVVGPADPLVLPIAKVDKNLLAQLTDQIQSVTDAMGNLSGAIDDLTRVQSEFKVFGQKVAGVLNAATYVVQAGQRFVAGTKQLLNIPLASVYALFGLAETVCALYADLEDTALSVADWPEAIVQSFRSTMKACDSLLSQGQVFDSRLSGQLNVLAYQPQQDASATPNTVVATSFSQIRLAGTADLAGEAGSPQAAEVDPGFGGPYLSVVYETVRKGDTLAKIAARTLGSALLWRDIAVLNQLQAPWSMAADAQAVEGPELDGNSGLLTYGSRILIPSPQPPAAVASTPVVVGAKPTQTPDAQLFGVDLALVRVAGAPGEPLYDLQMSGQGELALVSGPDAVAQAVEQNVVHQKGEVPLFPDVGLDAIIGTGAAAVDDTLLHYRISQALLADPRVASLASLQVARPDSAPDAIAFDATLVLSDGSEIGVQAAV